MVRALSAVFIAACVSACGASAEHDPIISEIKRADAKRWMATFDLKLEGFQVGQPTSSAVQILLALGWKQEEELIAFYAEGLTEPLTDTTMIFSKYDDRSSFACKLNRFVFIEQDGERIVSTRSATGEAGCL